MYYNGPAFHDLTYLVLGVSMNVDFHPVYSASHIVSGRTVEINFDSFSQRAESATFETLTSQIKNDEVPPAKSMSFSHEHCVALLALGFEVTGIHQKSVLDSLRWSQGFSG